MSTSWHNILGHQITLTGKTYIFETPKEECILTGEISIPTNSPPVMAFSQSATGLLAYDSERGVYMLVDETTNLPVYFIKVDEEGHFKVEIPTPADLGITIPPEEIDVMPFVYEILKKGLGDIPEQFKGVKKEIKQWINQKYGIKPKTDGFITWYVEEKLTPYIKAHSKLVQMAKHFAFRNMITSTPGEVCFDSISLPEITHEEIQEYCLYYNQLLETHDQSLQKTLPPSPSAEESHGNIKQATFQWLGPTNSTINQLDELYSLLAGEYLGSSIEVFRGAFGTGPFIGPVIWKATTSELIWLLLELQNFDFLEKRARQSWKMVESLFVGISKPFSATELKVLSSNLDRDLRVKAKEKITSIVECLIN
jgi:hypothetical protein